MKIVEVFDTFKYRVYDGSHCIAQFRRRKDAVAFMAAAPKDDESRPVTYVVR